MMKIIQVYFATTMYPLILCARRKRIGRRSAMLPRRTSERMIHVSRYRNQAGGQKLFGSSRRFIRRLIHTVCSIVLVVWAMSTKATFMFLLRVRAKRQRRKGRKGRRAPQRKRVKKSKKKKATMPG